MHVLAGKYKNCRLHGEPSSTVRPTTRRVREKVFELLADRIEGARFIDLCAGSGAVGIEALSRGAGYATFVDRSTHACAFINLNLEACGVPPDHYGVVTGVAFEFLRAAAERGDAKWDIAFFDPPYTVDYAPVMTLFATGKLLQPRGLLAVEHSSQRQPVAPDGLEYLGSVLLGESCLSFFEQYV